MWQSAAEVKMPETHGLPYSLRVTTVLILSQILRTTLIWHYTQQDDYAFACDE